MKTGSDNTGQGVDSANAKKKHVKIDTDKNQSLESNERGTSTLDLAAKPKKSALKTTKSPYGAVMQPDEIKAALAQGAPDSRKSEVPGAESKSTSTALPLEELLAKVTAANASKLRGHRRQQSSGKIELDPQPGAAPTRPEPTTATATGLQELVDSS